MSEGSCFLPDLAVLKLSSFLQLILLGSYSESFSKSSRIKSPFLPFYPSKTSTSNGLLLAKLIPLPKSLISSSFCFCDFFCEILLRSLGWVLRTQGIQTSSCCVSWQMVEAALLDFSIYFSLQLSLDSSSISSSSSLILLMHSFFSSFSRFFQNQFSS